MAPHTYTVTGMTCDHCVNSVRDEVSKITGVDAADVDLAGGTVTIIGDGFDDDQVRGAVNEAGYQLVDA